MSFFGLNFGQNADIDIILDDQENRKMADIRDENGRKERLYLYYDGESVSGKVNVTLHRKTSRLEHHGIKIEFIGQIELYYDRGNHHEFLSLVKELARPGELTQNTAFDFEFNQVEKPYECYTGANVRLRYFLRVTIVRRLTDMVKEMDLLVHTLATYPDLNNPIKMEVGIEECLHIEFEYNKSKYHLKDVIVGKIYFLLVRIKIKHMEVAIIKRETTGSGPNTFHDNETIAKYEIMDGAPVKGESIPIRVFLAGYDLTPTMRDINKKFSVRYFLNLVLVDEEERRYFKQQEITLWRKAERPRKPYSLSGGAGGMAASVSGPLPLHHAMARHQGGDFPSQNIRTAPTPSNPNTPIVGGDHPVYGQVSGGNYNAHGDRQFSVETDEMNSSGNNSERDVVISSTPQQMVCEDDDNNSEPEMVSHDDVATSAEILSADLQQKAHVSDDKTDHVVKRNETAAQPQQQQPTSLKSSSPPPTSSGKGEPEVVSAAAAVATAAAAKSATSDDEDDRPRPPDDDSVPDEDSLIQATAEDDDDDDIIGNDDL